jgi:hypothetical protein
MGEHGDKRRVTTIGLVVLVLAATFAVVVTGWGSLVVIAGGFALLGRFTAVCWLAGTRPPAPPPAS